MPPLPRKGYAHLTQAAVVPPQDMYALIPGFVANPALDQFVCSVSDKYSARSHRLLSQPDPHHGRLPDLLPHRLRPV